MFYRNRQPKSTELEDATSSVLRRRWNVLKEKQENIRIFNIVLDFVLYGQ